MAGRCCISRRARGGGLGGLKGHMGASGSALDMAATSGTAGASGGVAVIAGGLANDSSIFITVVAFFVGGLHLRKFVLESERGFSLGLCGLADLR